MRDLEVRHIGDHISQSQTKGKKVKPPETKGTVPVEKLEQKLQELQKEFGRLARKLKKQAAVPNTISTRGTCDELDIIDGQMLILNWAIENAI